MRTLRTILAVVWCIITLVWAISFFVAWIAAGNFNVVFLILLIFSLLTFAGMVPAKK